MEPNEGDETSSNRPVTMSAEAILELGRQISIDTTFTSLDGDPVADSSDDDQEDYGNNAANIKDVKDMKSKETSTVGAVSVGPVSVCAPSRENSINKEPAVNDKDLIKDSSSAKNDRVGAVSLPGISQQDVPAQQQEEEQVETLVEATEAITEADLEKQVHDNIIAKAAVGQVVEDKPENPRKHLPFILMGCVFVIVVTVLIVALLGANKSNDDNDTTPLVDRGESEANFKAFLETQVTAKFLTEESALALSRSGSPQDSAVQWMLNNTLTEGFKANDNDDEELQTKLLEQYALATLYYSTNGPESWTSSSENNNAFLSNVDTCVWLTNPSEDCSENGHVIALDLNGMNLEGPIAEEIVLLSNLETLNLGQNGNLTGSLAFTGFENLQSVIFSETAMAGPLSFDDKVLSNLRILDLRMTGLSGSLPEELFAAGNLEKLDVRETSLSGPLPTAIGRLQNLTELYASDTFLTGSIPTEIAECRQLMVFDIAGAVNITGNLPTEIWDLPNLKTLDISSVGLQLELPSRMVQAPLEELLVSVGKLEGSIPEEIGQFHNLRKLDLSSNPFLVGSIPDSIGNLTILEVLDVSRNSGLTGTIPSQIGELTNLELVWTFLTSISGQIPTEIGQTTKLLEFNGKTSKLATSVPTEIGLLTNLQYFDIMFVPEVFGPIPTEMGALTDLEKFKVKGSLTGTLPTELAECSSLNELLIIHSEINGTIPSDYGKLTNMEKLILENNHLTGTLPDALSAMANIKRFGVGGNELTGTIPNAYGDWLLLEDAKFGGTNLTGVVGTRFCSGFNWKDYKVYADCDEFEDECVCCTHCCPNTSNKRACTERNPSDEDEKNQEQPDAPPFLPPV